MPHDHEHGDEQHHAHQRHEHAREPDDRDPQEFWDAMYLERPQIWSGDPNRMLVDLADDLSPGTALDLGSGEGADAIWLASNGWRVTATDISPAALERGARLAAAAGLGDEIEWQHHDLADTFPAGAFDLVSAQFLQSPLAGFPREAVLRRAADAVAPGGRLIVVGHAAFPPWSGHHDPSLRFPSPQDVLDAITERTVGWETVVAEVRTRPATGPDGEQSTLDDAVVMVRRPA